jgi:hypothetical protein
MDVKSKQPPQSIPEGQGTLGIVAQTWKWVEPRVDPRNALQVPVLVIYERDKLLD